MMLRRRGPRGLSADRPGRDWWRRMALLVAMTVTIASIIGYMTLSFTANGLPSYQPSAGWVAVLQPTTAPNVDTVQILLQAQSQGGQTRAAYDVVVCGPRPYTGDLLIGGSARLVGIRPEPLLPTSAADLRIQRLPNLVFYFGGVIDLGPVQLVHITMPNVTACPSPAALQPSSALPGGTDEGVVGTTAKPIQQSWRGWWGWWHGPHTSQAWPLTGAFPGVPPNVLGQFIAVTGLRGTWIRPLQEYCQVTAVGVPVSWSTDSALPALSTPYPPTWQSRNPITPMLRLSDSSALAILQDWIVILVVVFGIFGALLASFLFEWLRRPPRQDGIALDGVGQPQRRSGSAAAPPKQKPVIAAPSHWLALASIAIAIGYARGLSRGRRR